MTLALLYPWLKALHVASAMIFTGGVIGVAMFLAAARGDPSSAPAARQIRRWDQAVTTPAMLLVWSFGLIMAINGGWLADGWLQAKLVLVVLLSAVHGVQSGKLRRLSSGAPVVSPPLQPLILGCIVGIAILAIMKPFQGWPG